MLDRNEEEVVERLMTEHDLDAEMVLRALLRTMLDRHVRCRRDPRIGAGGQLPKPTVIEELVNVLHHERAANLKAAGRLAGEHKQDDPKLDEDAFRLGVVRGELAAVQAVLMEMLFTCQRVAERDAGVAEQPDEDENPPMRLVTD